MLRKVGEVVRRARRDANLSQEQLAALAGLSRRPVYHLETGRGAVGLDSLVLLLDCLGLEIAIVPKADTE
ncbi:MAG: helix-turn-helix domain-containing protein [Fimbriimonadaceae bacterium]|nr:helix-turn-helix transcriptional regulator [Chthonomonadaceae bacterium]MCO5296455.1 helix-turn-helix domain-containing protein [Fimbriimonadaceae bacterium]